VPNGNVNHYVGPSNISRVSGQPIIFVPSVFNFTGVSETRIKLEGIKMKSSTMFALFGVVGGWISLSEPLHAQSQARQSSAQAVAQVRALSRLEQSLKASGSEGKFTFIVFSKEDNAAAREMLGVVETGVAERHEQAVVVTARANDPAEQPLIEHFGIGRAPMPLTVAVAPNGAVTGVFAKTINDELISTAIVTPTMMKCMKSLQNKQLVFVLVSASDKAAVPSGVKALQSDPQFRDRIAFAALRVDDPAEMRFISQMKIDPLRVEGPYAVLIAPPGVMVGHFDSTSTASQISAAIHKSGQCCDDPNCKHAAAPAQTATKTNSSRKN
jgi:hypothetical protein